jgi:hypothetical protein
MIFILTGMGALFVAIGFIVTENNAKYLLSGYNTMKPEERKKVDMKAYIPFFRKFHVFLGLSFIALGAVLNYLISELAAGIFLATYPLLAYLWFVWQSKNYSENQARKQWIGIAILMGALLFVAILLTISLKENPLTVDSGKVIIEGSYGEEIPATDIDSIVLIGNLPEISIRTNGFAMGSVRKGYFKTSSGGIVKLLINAEQKSNIFIRLKSGKKIYYSAKNTPNQTVYNDLKAKLSGPAYGTMPIPD